MKLIIKQPIDDLSCLIINLQYLLKNSQLIIELAEELADIGSVPDLPSELYVNVLSLALLYVKRTLRCFVFESEVATRLQGEGSAEGA